MPSLANLRAPSNTLLDAGEPGPRTGILPLVDAHPGLSGVAALFDPRDAFAARMLLAQSARRTLDVRYYIWRSDISGKLLLEALRAAADRGVHVRLLLDDNNTSELDGLLVALDAHPNIEIRLFNPFLFRRWRWLGYATDFFRLNRRMHNKSFTADDAATIVGGRNVGDEYFGATNGVLFADLDVFAVGPVVAAVAKDFDRYWSSKSAYPADRLLPAANHAEIAEVTAAARRAEREPAAVAYVNAVRESSFVREWNDESLSLIWAPTLMISDDPAKVLGRAARKTLVVEQLTAIIGESCTRFDLVSPYFVPTASGTAALGALARRGVSIRILTNSLEATDVSVVHAGYARRRKALLRSGIALYELRRLSDAPPPKKGKGSHRFSSSGSSLHAKTFSVDRLRVFVGSFNFDPRSATLNTEMGFVIDSPGLAQTIEGVLSRRIPTAAYEVRLCDRGRLEWIEHRDGESIRYDVEPGTSFWLRARVKLWSLLPVDWLL